MNMNRIEKFFRKYPYVTEIRIHRDKTIVIIEDEQYDKLPLKFYKDLKKTFNNAFIASDERY